MPRNAAESVLGGLAGICGEYNSCRYDDSDKEADCDAKYEKAGIHDECALWLVVVAGVGTESHGSTGLSSDFSMNFLNDSENSA